MSTITTTDGTQIFYKDWGPRDAQAIVFHHGWPKRAIASSLTTAVAMVVRPRPTPAMRWTPMPPMSPP
jgi:pimeloyl-ACP methyl ester carboxylesterase